MDLTYHKDNFHKLCDLLASKDASLRSILENYGYPPLWKREPGFPTLVHIILEQQVSLASALAAFRKLEAYLGKISPEKILALSDDELRQCYFSRQKTSYVKTLSAAIMDGKLNLSLLPTLPDAEVKQQLTRIKGIGNWTADVYLLMALNRLDIFPIGDLALRNSIKKNKGLSANVDPQSLIDMAKAWQPYRSIATMLFWHAYLERNK